MGKVYWKVCTVRDGKYSSALSSLNEFVVHYVENQWVKPLVGCCFIFRTKKDAIRFWDERNYQCVKRCEVKNAHKPPFRLMPDFMEQAMFAQFWGGNFMLGHCYVPEGTLLADAVKILPDK